MPKWLLIFMGVLVIASGCCKEIKEKLAKCEEELEECKAGGTFEGEAAFKLVLENDAFGTFLPVNNQFPAYVGTGIEFQSGFFAQLGTISDDGHDYTHLQLVHETGDDTGDRCQGKFECLPRQDVKWVDIVCSSGAPEVLTSEEAQLLIPEQEVVGSDLVVTPGTEHRVLHEDMRLSNIIALVTLWQSDKGLEMSTINFELPDVSSDTDGELGTHWHDRFAFRSTEPCEVRIWADLDPSTVPEVYSPDDVNPVVEVRVFEATLPADHGSVHHPPWG